MDVWAASPGRKRKRMADPARVAGGRKGEKLDGVRLTATFDPTITLPAQPPRAPPAGTPSTSQADLLLNSLGISQGSASVLQLAAAMGLGRGGVSPSVGGLALPPPVPQLAASASDMTAGSKSSTLLQPLYRSGSGRFCSKCGAPRVDVRFPCCQAGYHARCVYPWPVVTCPTCAKHVSCVTIVSVEPLVRNGVTIPVPQGTTRLRGGRWCEAEVKYAESVIEAFNTGLLPISEGTRLGSLLCNLLQCTPARLSSKLRTGKKNFHYLRGPVSAQQVYSYEQHQRKLSEQEELFLHYIPAEEAAAASSSFQLEWRIQFIGQAKRLGQRIDNLHEWAGLVNEHREADELRSSLPDGVDDDNDSDSVSASVDGESLSAAYGVEGGGGKMSRRSKVGAKTSAAMAAGTALGTLMCTLVRISADRRQRFTVQDGVSTATTFDDMLSLLKAGSEFECSLLARASNWSILFASAGLKKMLGRDDGDLLGSPLAESSANGLVHPSDVMALEVACTQSRKDVGVLLEQLGNPRSQLVESELSLVPVALRLRRRHGAFIERYFSVFATDMFVLLHGSVAEVEPGSQSEYQALGLAGLGALSADVRAVKHPGVDRGVEGMTGAAAGVPQPAMARSRASSFSAPGAPGLPMSSTPTNSLQPTPSPALPASSSSSPSNAVVQTAAAAMLSMQRALGGNAISTITTTTSNPHQSADLGPALVLPPAPPHIQPMMTMQPQQPSQLQQHHFAQSMGVTPSSSLTTTSSYTPTSTASADDTALTAFMAQVARVAGQSREDDDQHTKEWDETLDWSNHDDEDAGLIPLSCTFTNQSSSTDDACVGAYDLCYAPPASFEQTMRTFLIGLPFEAVDIWVPTRNPNGNGLSLQFGGGVALRSDLHQWIFYSRTFEFLAGQGMPGRVFQFMRPEYQEDVCLLDNSLFLRKEGAREAGVHVSFGLPIGQNEHTFVLVSHVAQGGFCEVKLQRAQFEGLPFCSVADSTTQLFYSSKRSSITQEVLDFIRRSTSSWRISTTLEGGSEWCGSGSSSPSASPRQGPSAQGPLLLQQQQKQQQQQPQQAMVPWLRRVPLAVPPPAHQHQGATLFEGSMSMASHNSPMAPTTQHHANVNSFGGGDGGAGGGPVGRYSV